MKKLYIVSLALFSISAFSAPSCNQAGKNNCPSTFKQGTAGCKFCGECAQKGEEISSFSGGILLCSDGTQLGGISPLDGSSTGNKRPTSKR